MPPTRPATIRAEDLPDVATIAEVAAFERRDPRIIRHACEAGRIAGAWREGQSWRVLTSAYLQARGDGSHAAL